MAHSKSAKKRIRQSQKARMRNRHYRSQMKTYIKRVLASTDKTAAETELRNTVALLDKLASKRIIHRNKAANQKSRLTRYVNSLS
jgi:small subunit ribosomal protein S20